MNAATHRWALVFIHLIFWAESSICLGEESKIHFCENTLYSEPKVNFTVFHIQIKGTNEQIGFQLAEIGKKRYDVKLPLINDPQLASLKRDYFSRAAPLLWQRMQGVLTAFKISPSNAMVDSSALVYSVPKSASSGFYVPSSLTKNGHTYVSRAFDLIKDMQSNPLAFTDAYILELYPEEGFSSISVGSTDLLNPVFEGVNSVGLSVSSYVVEETPENNLCFSGESRAGLTSLQLLSHLLTCCDSVHEAKHTLVNTKAYFPCFNMHFLISDSKGNSFVFETDPQTGLFHLVDNKGKETQIIANHLLFKQNPKTSSPRDYDSISRYQKLKKEFSSLGTSLITESQVKTIASKAFIPYGTKRISPEETTGLYTLWHSIYDLDDRTLQISFLKVSDSGEEPSMSSYFTFSLMVPSNKHDNK